MALMREFLRSRRARITPEQAGLPTFGGSRRVPGLRREEVALLAGVSVDYYTRLERGNATGASDSVLAAVARALQLDSELFGDSRRPANTARFVFLDPRAPAFFPDWDRVANEVVAALHSEAGRDPYDRDLSDLVGELSTQSETFRTLWAAHDVHAHDSGVKRLHHPLVGELTLTYETMELAASPGLTIAVYTADPGSKSEEALELLASWTATPDQPEPTGATDR
jgi:transcriptional regulator with XRE-family HTH domain